MVVGLTPGETDDRLQQFRDKTTEVIADALLSCDPSLVLALMGLGKTYTAGIVIKYLGGANLTIYTKLWDTREQIRDYVIENTDLTEEDIKILPTLDRFCPSFKLDDDGNPEHPEVYAALSQARNQGATAKVIHQSAKYLPCTENGPCPYNTKMKFDPDDYRIIIGSPQHAYVPPYNEDRFVLIDEDAAEAFETELDGNEVNKAVNYYLKEQDGLDVNSIDVLMNMGVRERAEILEYIEKEDMWDPNLALNTSGGRADAAAIVRSLLEYNHLKTSGYFRSQFDDGEGSEFTIVRNANSDGGMTLRQPPRFHGNKNIVAMDGTPHREMWENRLGFDLEHEKVLDDQETQEYISDVLNYNIYLTSTTMNPYSSGEHTQENQCFAVLEEISRYYGQQVPFISSKAARDKLKDSKPNVYDTFIKDDCLYYNNLRSHSEYEYYVLLFVAGCKMPGDDEVQRLAALDGYDIPTRGDYKDRADDGPTGGTFGDEGDSYYEYVCHNEVAQAIFRVGRGDGADGADIFVHTGMIPDWIPVDGVIGENQDDDKPPIRIRTPEQQTVFKALQNQRVAKTKTIAEMCELTQKQVRTVLKRAKGKYVNMKTEGGHYYWIDAGVEHVPWHGEVDLPN